MDGIPTMLQTQVSAADLGRPALDDHDVFQPFVAGEVKLDARLAQNPPCRVRRVLFIECGSNTIMETQAPRLMGRDGLGNRPKHIVEPPPGLAG